MKKVVAYVLGLLLLAAPLLGALAQEASAASSRVAVIKELKGSVKVKKSGGSKEFTAFAKMSLNEGDIVKVGSDGSAVLQFANGSSEDDQMTVSANTTLTFSKLKEGKNTVTKVSVQNGSVWSTVKSIKSASDEYTLETPTAIMGVRGTNLLVYVDPITGDSKFVIFSGVGQIVPTNTRTVSQPPDVLVYPNHQVTIDDRNQTTQFPDEVIPIDLPTFLNGASPQVIASILEAKNAIDRENQQFIDKKKQELEAGQPGSSTGSIEELDRLAQNLNNLVANMLQEALKGNKITSSELQKLIDEANRSLDKKIDLNNTPPQALTDAEKRKMEQLKKQQEARQETAKKQQEEELKRQQESLIKKIEEERAKQEAANQKAQEEAKNKAKEEYEKKLSEAEKKRFEEESKKREEELKNQTAPRVTPTPSSGGGGGGGSNPGSSPSQSPSQSPSESPSPSPDPTLPSGITGWTLTTDNNQPLEIVRTKQIEQDYQHETIYAVKTESVVSSLKLKLEFGSDVSKVTLMGSGNFSEGQTIEWNTSGEVKTIGDLEEGYENFFIYVTKTQSDSSNIETLYNLFVLNGVSEHQWSDLEDPFKLENAEYEKVGDQFSAVVPLSEDTLYLRPYTEQNDLLLMIDKLKVNGVETAQIYFADLIVGMNEIDITVADEAYFYKHTYKLFVNRNSLPEGIDSWSIVAGQQMNNIVVSNEKFAYAILPSASQGAYLKVELAEGYTGEIVLSNDSIDLEELILLDTSSDGYYRYYLNISNSELEYQESIVLTVKVGNAVVYNELMGVGGISLNDDSYGMIYNQMNGGFYYNFYDVATTPVRLNPYVFIGNFVPDFMEPEDIQILGSEEEVTSEGWEYFLYGLQPGSNSFTLIVDPLRQFGPDAMRYSLDINVGAPSV